MPGLLIVPHPHPHLYRLPPSPPEPMAPSQSALSLLQSVVSRPQMENTMSSETGVQSAEDGVRSL